MEHAELNTMFEKAFPFWSHLRETDRETLCRGAYHRTFAKGTNIHDGNQCTGVIFIQRGSLRLYMLSEDGREITLYRLFAGEFCMLSASCVSDAITFDVFVDSEENSDCIVVGGCAFVELTERLPEVKVFALETTISRFSDMMWSMQQILFLGIDKRLAIFLLDECAKTASDTVVLTHEQIAKYMGSAREVVSRMLKHFALDGLVEVSRKGVKLIDKPRLRAMTR